MTRAQCAVGIERDPARAHWFCINPRSTISRRLEQHTGRRVSRGFRALCGQDPCLKARASGQAHVRVGGVCHYGHPLAQWCSRGGGAHMGHHPLPAGHCPRRALPNLVSLAETAAGRRGVSPGAKGLARPLGLQEHKAARGDNCGPVPLSWRNRTFLHPGFKRNGHSQRQEDTEEQACARKQGARDHPEPRTRRIADVCAALARDLWHGVPPHGGGRCGTAGGKVANARREELGCRRDRLVAER